MNYAKRKSTDYIVIHCTATPEERDIGVKEVDRMHRQRGFLGCGYHYVIRLDGTIETGRPEDAVGAHVEGWNSKSIGISYVGGVHADNVNLAKDTRTDAQKAALLKLLTELKTKYPKATIMGHRDFPGVKKACPCFPAISEYAHIKPVQASSEAIHEVYAGDTLYSIARDHGISLGKLLELNPGVSTVIHPGQILKVQ